MGKTYNYLVAGAVLLALLGVCYFGYTMYPKFNKCPDVLADTVYVKDTILHYIPDTIPYYTVIYDSIVYHDTVYKDVDTAEILKDYFAVHYFTRNWTDSLLTVTLKDAVSRNSLLDNTFTYKILRDQQVINNVINIYSKYVMVGASLPTKSVQHFNLNVEINYVTPKFYVGIGYDAELNCPTIRGGAVVKQF